MATAVWNGVAPGVFITNTNWAPNNVPIDGDILSANRQNSQSIQGANHAGIYLGSFTSQAGYAGNIGSNGNPLIIDAVEWIHRGLGTLWLASNNGVAGVGETTGHVIIDSDNMNNAATLDGEKIDVISCVKGKTTLAATLGTSAWSADAVVPSRVNVGRRDNIAVDAHLVINGNYDDTTTTMVTEVNQYGGKVESVGVIDLYNMMAGRCYQTVEEIVRLMQYGGYMFYGAERTTGVMTEAHIFGGVLDLSYLARGITVTDTYLYPGGTLVYDPNLTVFTNAIHNYGGILKTVRATGHLGHVQLIGGGAGNP